MCLPRDQIVSLTVVYRDMNVDASLAQRINISDFSQSFVKIENLSTQVNYSVQLQLTGGCGEDQKTEPVFVVTGKGGKRLFTAFSIE